MPKYRLAFMGFGNVGKSLAHLLLDKRAELDERIFDVLAPMRGA